MYTHMNTTKKNIEENKSYRYNTKQHGEEKICTIRSKL